MPRPSFISDALFRSRIICTPPLWHIDAVSGSMRLPHENCEDRVNVLSLMLCQEQLFKGRSRHRMVEEVTLPEVAPGVPQQIGFMFFTDSFSDHPHAKCV